MRAPTTRLRVTPRQVELTIDGHDGKVVLPSDPSRRNTLGAGDSVRGAVAYGLWQQAREEKVAEQPSIDFA